MRPTRVLSLALAVAAAACADGDPAAPDDLAVAETRLGPGAEATYRVTFTNLTAGDFMPPGEIESGQPFTPPLVAVHRRAVTLFEVGRPAGEGVQQVAENGNLAPMISSLGDSRHVMDMVVAAAPMGVPPVLNPGESRSIEVTARRGANHLSFVAMLICTNDGFTGLSSLRLPHLPGETLTVRAGAYDAGTEINTEDYADLVPPCQGLYGVDVEPGTGTSDPELAEGGIVRHHPGIAGGEDLEPGVHGWTDPVIEVEVTRIG